ncbi:hypothetical protein QBC47DRAFT_433152 [Echria macrotheca]|uniref:Yeast cell wall synthesis Kre9/Knh1-like N-terminal domain-containing protein n=1 Tax=Echria macrotheca TaxID=438768 RepID=A0AAJ0B5Q6_9PEZI|nr:hypothetical protein QBC47DRAFT_433152 [Echria macrotheca]
MASPWFWRRLFVALLWVQSTIAAVAFTNTEFDVQIGKPFTLTWTGASGSVTITLQDASSGTSNLKTVLTVVSSTQSTSYTWTPPSSLSSGTYAFKIADVAGDTVTTDYSATFPIVGVVCFALKGPAAMLMTAKGTNNAFTNAFANPNVHAEDVASFDDARASDSGRDEPQCSTAPSPAERVGYPFPARGIPFTRQSIQPLWLFRVVGLVWITGNLQSINSRLFRQRIQLLPSRRGKHAAAKAGIGAGAGVLGLFLIVAVAYFFYRRGKAAGAKGSVAPDNDEDGGIAELGGAMKVGGPHAELGVGSNEKPPVELGGKGRVEMAATESSVSPASPFAGYVYPSAGAVELGAHPPSYPAELGGGFSGEGYRR